MVKVSVPTSRQEVNGVADPFINKKSIKNTKCNTKLTVQAVYVLCVWFKVNFLVTW